MTDTTTDFVIGYHALIEIIDAGKTVEKVLLQKGATSDRKNELLTLLKKHDIPMQIVPLEKLNRVTRKNHQGVIGFISPVEFYNLENLVQRLFEQGTTPLLLLLDEVTDVRNFGAICRSADCLGVHGVVIPLRGSARIGADAMKTSAGALSRVPVCRVTSLAHTAKYLKESGFKVVGCTEKANKDLAFVELNVPLALVMGAEDEGISNAVTAQCDILAKIPLMGKIGSLNVSVAAGIALYEINCQRSLKE